MKLSTLKEFYQKQIGQKERIEKDIQILQSQIKKDKKHYTNLEQAKEIIRIVGLETQKQLQFHITNISSLALDSVFNDPYKVQLDFVERRGKTECDILFERNGSTIKPKDSSGYGTLDVASLALRIACWSMQMPRTSRIMIIDEPFRNLSKDNEEATSLMLKELSSKLGIQLIIISHSEILATYADKIFKLKKDKNKITQIV